MRSRGLLARLPAAAAASPTSWSTREGRDPPGLARFIDHLAALRREELARRFARGDQYLRDAGVFFRQYGASGPTERAWPLAHVPVLIDEDEWRATRRAASSSAPTCSSASSPTSTARTAWSPRATCPRR